MLRGRLKSMSIIKVRRTLKMLNSFTHPTLWRLEKNGDPFQPPSSWTGPRLKDLIFRLTNHESCHLSYICWNLRFACSFFFFLRFIYYLFIYFIYFWLHRVLVAARGIFVVACGIFSCGTELLSSCGAQAPGRVGSVVVVCGVHSAWAL